MMESVLPAIVKSGDPEGELLKCASAHNLPIAQVEKLGQVFNTYKTLTGLSVQKNRGDSFSIVDVPSLVEKYASYNPKKVLKKQASGNTEGTVKYADSDGWKRMFDRDADSYKITTGSKDDMVHSLRDIMDAAKADIAGGVVSDNQNSFREFHDMKGHYDITFDKRASVKQYKEIESTLKVAEEDARQIAHEIKQAVAEKCASIMGRLNPDEGRWAEAVEDIYDVYGKDAANAIHTVENYFDSRHHRFTPADLTKRAFAQPVVEDRHGVFGDIEEIMKLDKLADRMGDEFFKRAATVTSADLDVKINKLTNQLSGVDNWLNSLSPTSKNVSAVDIRTNKELADMLKNRISALTSERDKLREAENNQQIVENYEKIPVNDRFKPKGEATEAAIKALDEATAPVKNLLSGMKSPYYNQHYTMSGRFNYATGGAKKIIDAIAGDKFNDRKRQLDLGKAKTQAKMDSALQQLMLSDPVISKADPTEVQDLFNSIKELSPVLATNPTLMGPTLKEALQVGGIPIQLLSEVAKFNESWHKSHGGYSSKEDHEKNSYDTDK